MIRRLALSLSVLIVISSYPSANAASLLAIADGKWSGKGWFRQTISDPKRATKCRLNMQYLEARKVLSISGKCAGGGKSARVSGRLVEKSARSYAGQWNANGGFSARNMSGTRRGNRILLQWRAKPQNSLKFERYSALWNISKNRISVSFSIGRRGEARLSNLVLQR